MFMFREGSTSLIGHMLCVTCHGSPVTWFFFFFFLAFWKEVLKLVGGGSVINRAYPRGVETENNCVLWANIRSP